MKWTVHRKQIYWCLLALTAKRYKQDGEKSRESSASHVKIIMTDKLTVIPKDNIVGVFEWRCRVHNLIFRRSTSSGFIEAQCHANGLWAGNNCLWLLIPTNVNSKLIGNLIDIREIKVFTALESCIQLVAFWDKSFRSMTTLSPND